MKKLVYLLVAVSLMLALVPTMALAHTEDAPLVVDLLAGQTEDIGDVKVWNDADNLYVQFVYTGPDCGFLEVHLQVDDEGAFSPDIFTKKSNPIPGQFEKSYKSGGCFTEYTFTYDLVAEGFDCDGTLWIAAHAALGREEAMTFESNVGDIVYGPISSNDMPTDWGSAGSAVQAYNWLGYTRDLSDPDQIPGCTTNPYSSLSWSWGFGLNPTYSPDIPGVPWISTAPNTEQWDVDSWRKFVENYEVPGYPIAGSLQVNADNYYVVSNGETIGSDDNIFNGPETYAFYPMEGPNILEFVTENWAQGSPTNYCDQLANPNGVTYRGTVSYYADGETAWACGNGSEEPNCYEFLGKNWATYFTYTVQESKIVIAGWDTGRGGNYSLNSADSAQARNDLQTEYDDVEFRALSVLDATSLAGVDVVVLSSVKANSGAIIPWLSEAEQDALYNFVLGGGCAILFPDNSTFAGGNSDPANESLIDPFGLDIMGTLGGGYNASVTSAPSPVTNGVASYSGNYAGWFDGTNGATVLANITVSGQAQPSLVEFAPGHFGTGSGRVVVFSDANVFFGGGTGKYSSNTQLFLNSVDACFQP